MKLNSFKFQDGKVFWLPEYPEKTFSYCSGKPYCCEGRRCDVLQHDDAIAHSLASAIEVIPEDKSFVLKLISETINMQYPKNGKVYSAECEMEVKLTCNNLLKPPHMEQKCDCDVICLSPKKVSRLKPALETVKP